MNKIKNLLVFYFLFLSISVVTYSCCTNPQYEVYDIDRIVALNRDFVEIDTVSGSFTFEASFKFQEVSSLTNLGLVNSAYATSCPTEYTNQISSTGFEFFCDQDFIYKNDTVHSGTGLSSIPELEIFIATDPYSQQMAVGVTDSFLTNAQFTKGAHLFNFVMETTDDKILKGDLSLVMDL